eukprot:jgi/Hompol1/3714/HPOL_006696-RA
MREANIVAVPVYRIPISEPSGRLYTGIVSVFDVVAGTIGDLVGKTRESADSWTLHSADPITALLQMFTTVGYHRMLVIDEDAVAAATAVGDSAMALEALPSGSCVRIVTQTDLVKFMLDMAPALQLQYDLPLSQEATDPAKAEANEKLKRALEFLWSQPASACSGIAVSRIPPAETDANQPMIPARTHIHRVIKVHGDVSTITGLRRLYFHRVSALAVTDAEGHLEGTLSASDLRGITHESLPMLASPIIEFLERQQRPKKSVRSDQIRSVDSNTPMIKAAAEMLDSHVHRLWITDEDDMLKGVVSMTDVLTMFVSPASLF